MSRAGTADRGGTSHGAGTGVRGGRGDRATLSLEEVAVGGELPTLDIPITRTLIVAAAIASRDYQDVHHDPELAVERGSEDIFMNILTTNGLVGRYVTDWAGPGALITDVDIRLGVPNYPGDTMTMSGSVTEVDSAAGAVVVGVRGANSRGDHVTGSVRLVLPRPGRTSGSERGA